MQTSKNEMFKEILEITLNMRTACIPRLKIALSQSDLSFLRQSRVKTIILNGLWMWSVKHHTPIQPTALCFVEPKKPGNSLIVETPLVWKFGMLAMLSSASLFGIVVIAVDISTHSISILLNNQRDYQAIQIEKKSQFIP